MTVAAVSTGPRQVERRMRRRRVAKVTLLIVFAVVWIPVAVMMIVAGMPDRRA